MKAYTQFYLGFLLALIAVVDSTSKDYTWRDFDGELPKDALRAGSDRKGRVYVGQVLFEGKLIPGKLYENDPVIYFEHAGKGLVGTQNIKILCTKHPENFLWVASKNTKHHEIKNLALVSGGFENGFKTYIGKSIENGAVDVGKVMCQLTTCMGLYTWEGGNSVSYNAYYILVYYPRH